MGYLIRETIEFLSQQLKHLEQTTCFDLLLINRPERAVFLW